MPMLTLAEADLVHACRILFGSELQVNRAFLDYLQPAGVKSAFRKRALETHPDRVATQGELIRSRHAALFLEAQQAYRDLTDFLAARERGFRLPPAMGGFHRAPPRGESAGFRAHRPGPGNRPAGRGAEDLNRSSFYQGPLPERPLLFGHYLYYSGMTTWRTIIQAVIWQRTQRPRLGQLGQRFGWLAGNDVPRILRDCTLSQPFGQTAIHLGLLNERQVRILLFQQQRLQKKIGEYFVEEGILTPVQLQDLLTRFQTHNRRLTAAMLHHRFRP